MGLVLQILYLEIHASFIHLYQKKNLCLPHFSWNQALNPYAGSYAAKLIEKVDVKLLL